MSRKIGYYRVSTSDQNTALQIKALKRAGCSPVLGDCGLSGGDTRRPEFNKAMEMIKAGDTLVIWRLDRMSRSLKHLIEINQALRAKSAYFESLTEKIDTATPMGEFVFHILGAVAQLERAVIRERTMAGLEVAASKGRYPGRPRKLSEDQLIEIADYIITGQARPKDVAAEFGVHPETIRRYMRGTNPGTHIRPLWLC